MTINFVTITFNKTETTCSKIVQIKKLGIAHAIYWQNQKAGHCSCDNIGKIDDEAECTRIDVAECTRIDVPVKSLLWKVARPEASLLEREELPLYSVNL